MAHFQSFVDLRENLAGSELAPTAAQLELLAASAWAGIVPPRAWSFRRLSRRTGLTTWLRISDMGRHPRGETGSDNECGKLCLLQSGDSLEVECLGGLLYSP